MYWSLVLPANPEEFEIIAAFHHFVRLLGQVFGQGQSEIVALFLRDGTLVSPSLDLVEQDFARPAEAGGGVKMPEASREVADFVENEPMTAPGDFGHKLWPKLSFWNRLFQSPCKSRRVRRRQFGHSLLPN